MKKIVSVLLAIGLISLMVSAGFTAEFPDVENSEAIDTICGIGLMEGYTDGTFQPDNNLTRAEFAQIAAKIYKYGEDDNKVAEWKQSFFEGVYEEIELIPPEEMNKEESELFWDVNAQGETYDAIKLVYQKGIMVGYGDGSFNPDGNLTIEQALKVIMSMMGYGRKAVLYGGYPGGYVTVAAETGITDGLGSLTDYATREDIAKILYNALDVPLMQFSVKGSEMVYDSDEDDTFLTKLLNIDYDKGRVTDNGYTSFAGATAYSEDWVVINNVRYKITAETEYVRDFIGRDVKAYYSLDEDDDGLIYVTLTGKDEAVTFDISEFEGYEDSKIKYLLKDSGREKFVNIKSALYMIKNGKAVSSFDDDIFDFNYGTITAVIPKDENAADLIVIKSYYNFNIDYVDAENEVIYSSSSILGSELDLNSEKKNVKIYDPQGNLTDIKSLASGVVTSVCMNDEMVEIYISDKEEKAFKVTGIKKDDYDNHVLEGAKASFILSKDYIDKGTGIMPKIGSVYNLKLDIFGNVTVFDELAAEYNVAFMNDARLIEDESGVEKIRIRYYDFVSQKLESVFLANKVKVIDVGDSKTNYYIEKSHTVVETLLKDYISKEEEDGTVAICGNIFRFKTNEQNEISEIELAGIQENSNDDSQRLVEIKISPDTVNGNMYNGKDLLGGRIIINNNTKILKCNYTTEKFNTDAGYSITTKASLKENGRYDMRAFSTTKNSPIAEYIIFTSDPTKSISTESPQTCGVVTDLYSGLNADDEPVYVIGIDGTEYEVGEEVLGEGNIPNMQGATSYDDANGKTHNFKIEKGDLIRYGIGVEGEISQVQLVYDANSDYSDGLTVGGVVYDGFSKRGNLAGCIDGYNSDVNPFSNPFSANSTDSGNEFLDKNKPYDWSHYNGYMRVMLGTVLRTGNGYIVTTTRNLQENPGKVLDDGDGVYATNTWCVSSCKVVTVGNKEVKITTESISNLRSYTALATSCDRIIITSRLGTVFNAIVYRYAK